MPGYCRVSVRLVVLLLVGGGVHGHNGNSEESPLQRRIATSMGHGRQAPVFGAERPSHAEIFNHTKVLLPEYQIRATLMPNNVSQFYYLSPKSGPPPTLLVSPCSGPIFWSVSYVGPPETDQHAEGTKSAQTHWPVNQMIPGSPLFKYEGAETQNFTILAATQGELYLIDMRPVNSPMLDLKTRSPNTVLLYATTDYALGHLPGNLGPPRSGKRGQQPALLEFKQRLSRRRIIVSWNKSYADPSTSSYLLAVTSGAQMHPPTLCAAENILKKHPCRPSGVQQGQDRSEPEGLHCVRKTKLTLFGVKYNTTYYFTLYIMNTQNNVSSRVAMDSFRFERKPPITLQTGRYATANLRKNEGFVIFRYRPRDNATTMFYIRACGACMKAKFRGPDYSREEQIGGELSLRAPALPPGRRFSIQITASQFDLVKMSRVKILATDDEATPVTDNSAARNMPWEYRTLRKCRAKQASWCASVQNPGGASSSSSSSSGPCASGSSPTRGPAHSLGRPCPSP